MGHYLFTMWDAGAREVRPWIDAPHHVTRRAEDDYTRDWAQRTPMGVLAALMDTLIVGPAPTFAAETSAAIADLQPDVLVSSFPLFGAMLAAEAREVPFAVLVPNIVALPVDGMPPYGTGLRPPRGRLGRTRDRTANALVERLWNKGLPALNEARAALDLAPLQRLLEQYDRAERILALTSAAFDFPAVLPPNVRYVGPQLDEPSWVEPWTPPVDDRPFVLVAMSTTFMDHIDQLQRATTALGILGVHGLVTTGPAVDPEAIEAPEGVVVVRSAPHRDVLAHADALVTHGGHGTVMKGLVAGVPIVCMPTGRDQPDNAARIAHRGAGIKVSRNASPAKIASALRKVLDDPSFKTAATRLGEQAEVDAGSGAALRELEALASH
jgi:MGT family glycosyltransferase